VRPPKRFEGELAAAKKRRSSLTSLKQERRRMLIRSSEIKINGTTP